MYTPSAVETASRVNGDGASSGAVRDEHACIQNQAAPGAAQQDGEIALIRATAARSRRDHQVTGEGE
jgi:hypothetical protein